MYIRIPMAMAFAMLLALPFPSIAGKVGYYPTAACNSPADFITAAGHTPVPINTLDAASLKPLDGLVLLRCSNISYSGDPDVDQAVANGMALLLDSDQYNGTHPYLPGNPGFSTSFACPPNIDLAANAPIANGPGGTLTDASLDNYAGGLCILVGSVQASQLPAGAIPFLLSGSSQYVGAFGYAHGGGRVAFSMSQFTQGVQGFHPWWPASRTYLANALDWAISNSVRPDISCASEGYAGTQLTWCQNICEKGYTGTTLDMWIRRWMGRWHDLPYCAREDEESPPEEGGE